MNEEEIRDALITHLGKNAIFVKELHVQNFTRRVDLLMLGDSVTAFEIKSEKDSLKRLDGQIECFQNLFERVVVVCADKHLDGVLKKVGENIAVWRVDDQGAFHVVRGGKPNNKIPLSRLASILPVYAIKDLMKTHKISSSGTKEVLLKRVEGNLSVEQVKPFLWEFFSTERKKISFAPNSMEAYNQKQAKMLENYLGKPHAKPIPRKTD